MPQTYHRYNFPKSFYCTFNAGDNIAGQSGFQIHVRFASPQKSEVGPKLHFVWLQGAFEMPLIKGTNTANAICGKAVESIKETTTLIVLMIQPWKTTQEWNGSLFCP
jgi:hypothetical protein